MEVTAKRRELPASNLLLKGLFVRLRARLSSPGFASSIPVLALFALGFAAPLITVVGFSLMPPLTFELTATPTLENFVHIVQETFYLSFLRAFAFASGTVLVLALVCYPIAYGMAKLFGRGAVVLTLVVILPLLVSENIRLFGWEIFLLEGGGVLAGTLKTLFGIEIKGMLYSPTVVLMGLVYVYFPFMLFPMVLGISMVRDDVIEAASDLGASPWQIFREVEIPLAMPGILIGGLLTFILSLGSLAEAKVLGGSKIIMIADDIESAFTYAQNWPLGSALSVLVVVLAGGLVLVVLRRLDLDSILGRR